MTSYERGRELSLGKKKWDTLKNLSLIKNYHFLTVSHFLFLRLYKDRDWNGFQGMIGLTMEGGIKIGIIQMTTGFRPHFCFTEVVKSRVNLYKHKKLIQSMSEIVKSLTYQLLDISNKMKIFCIMVAAWV